MTLTILHTVGSQPGWAPIRRMIALAGDVLGATAVELPRRQPGKLARILNKRPPRKVTDGSTLLAILPSPGDVMNLRMTPEFNAGYSTIAVWIIDSFATGLMSSWTSFSGIDLLAVSQSFDLAFYQKYFRGNLILLPWGSDVLQQSPIPLARPIDLARVGRQPPNWDDDAVTLDSARNEGLIFHGRPDFSENPENNQRKVTDLFRSAKCSLAFSNTVSFDSYTHRAKPYFTGRWADSLACGASVAGIPPSGDSAFADLLWENALIELPSLDRQEGMDLIRRFISQWTPRVALENHANALLKLDWRWRFQTLLRELNIHSVELDAQLGHLTIRANEILAA